MAQKGVSELWRSTQRLGSNFIMPILQGEEGVAHVFEVRSRKGVLKRWVLERDWN